MDIEFANLEELMKRVSPALTVKKEEMRRMGLTYIKEEDIWNYLKEIKWKHSTDLLLYQMVDDIMNTDNVLIDNYLKSKLGLGNRKVYFEQ